MDTTKATTYLILHVNLGTGIDQQRYQQNTSSLACLMKCRVAVLWETKTKYDYYGSCKCIARGVLKHTDQSDTIKHLTHKCAVIVYRLNRWAATHNAHRTNWYSLYDTASLTSFKIFVFACAASSNLTISACPWWEAKWSDVIRFCWGREKRVGEVNKYQ